MVVKPNLIKKKYINDQMNGTTNSSLNNTKNAALKNMDYWNLSKKGTYRKDDLMWHDITQ